MMPPISPPITTGEWIMAVIIMALFIASGFKW